VGRPKVNLVAERLRCINPGIKIRTYQKDLFSRPEQYLKKVFKNTSAIVATTDKVSVQLQSNDLAWQMKIPGIFAGCYEEARGGEVFCTLPGTPAPCYACLREGMPKPPRKGTIDYSQATGPEDYQGEPGLYSAIQIVTNVAVQAVLSVLLKNDPEAELGRLITPARNYLLVGTARSGGYYRFRKPFDIFFQPLKGPRKDCPTCQRESMCCKVLKDDIKIVDMDDNKSNKRNMI